MDTAPKPSRLNSTWPAGPATPRRRPNSWSDGCANTPATGMIRTGSGSSAWTPRGRSTGSPSEPNPAGSTSFATRTASFPRSSSCTTSAPSHRLLDEVHVDLQDPAVPYGIPDQHVWRDRPR